MLLKLDAISLHAARPLYTQLFHRMRIAAVGNITLPSVQENLEGARFAYTGWADALAFQRIRFGFQFVGRMACLFEVKNFSSTPAGQPQHPSWVMSRAHRSALKVRGGPKVILQAGANLLDSSGWFGFKLGV